MSLIKAGKIELLNSLFDRYGNRLYSYFLKSTLNKADGDDLTQELFIRVMKYRKSYKEGQSVEIWIFQIARNMVKDHFKKMKVYRDNFCLMEIIPEHISNEADNQQEREEQLYRAMSKLSKEKRELLVLSKFEGMKYEQIAILRKTSVSNIKVQVHRVIKELKDIYFGQEFEN